jgi:ABC-type multidrug transport system fused ATPase/permease subunit
MSFLTLVRKLWPFVSKYRRTFLLILLLTTIGAGLAQVTPIVMKYTVDTIENMIEEPVSGKQIGIVVGWLVVILFGKEILGLFVQLGQKFLSDRIRFQLGADLHNYTISRVVSYHLSFFALPHNQIGKLEKRIDKGIENLVKTVKNLFVDIFPMFISAFFALILMYYNNVWIGICATLIIPIYALISREQSKRQSQIRRNIQQFREEKAGMLFGLFESIFVVKSFVREDYEATRQRSLTRHLSDSEIKHHRTNYLFDSLKSMAEQLGIIMVFVVTVYFVLNKQIALGAIMFHLGLFNNVSAPIRHLHRIYDEYSEALTYAEGFFEMIENDSYIENPESNKLKPEAIKGNFELRDVNLVYPNGKHALKNISMTLQPGKTTALVGLSGAGKSSAMNLLSGFYNATQGEVLLDGKPLNSYDPHWVRDHVGLVMQKNHIFSGSVEDNIRYGRLDASFEEIIDAAKKASLHEQILLMPDGYKADAKSLSGASNNV